MNESNPMSAYKFIEIDELDATRVGYDNVLNELGLERLHDNPEYRIGWIKHNISYRENYLDKLRKRSVNFFPYDSYDSAINFQTRILSFHRKALEQAERPDHDRQSESVLRPRD